MCRVLGLSASGYYAWVRRGPSARARRDAQMTERIKEIWSANREVYGRPRIHAELQAGGERIGAKRVGRLMRRAGIAGASRRRSTKTTTREQRAARGAGSGRSGLQRRRRRSTLGGRHHLCKDVDGVSVRGGGAGCLESPGGGLVDGHPPAHRTGPGCAEHGHLAATAAGSGSPQRPGFAVHVDRVRGTVQGGRRTTVDRLGGRCVRQRAVRKLLRDPGV